jgi:hypothetical protein
MSFRGVYDPSRIRRTQVARPRAEWPLGLIVSWLWTSTFGRLPRPGRFAAGFSTCGLILLASACGGSTVRTVLASDTDLMGRQLSQLRKVTPPHFYLYSQDIVAMNAVMDARTAGKSTFSLFFNRGVADPYFMCPSRGYPIPGDTELTNPEQLVNGNYNGTSGYWGVTLPQIDPNGLYTSHATASTYVMCVAPNGQLYTKYAESDVDAFPFSVTWDYTRHQVVVDPSAVASFNVAYDAAQANQEPMQVIFNPDGSASLRNSAGTSIPLQPVGTPGTPAAR